MENEGNLDLISNLDQSWNNIVDVINLSSWHYEIIIYDIYSDDLDPNYGSERYFVRKGRRIKITYNGYTNYALYKSELQNILLLFRSTYITYIDNNIFSVGDRINYFLKKIDELKISRTKLFKVVNNNSTHKNLRLIHERDEYEVEDELELYKEEVIIQLNLFENVQYEFVIELEKMLANTALFINGRLEEYYTEPYDSSKLNFTLTRAELIIFLMKLNEQGFFGKTTYYSIAKFAEKHFLYQYKSLSGLQNTISSFKHGTDNISTSLESLREKLKSLF